MVIIEKSFLAKNYHLFINLLTINGKLARVQTCNGQFLSGFRKYQTEIFTHKSQPIRRVLSNNTQIGHGNLTNMD
jgi:hypothetical protein